MWRLFGIPFQVLHIHHFKRLCDFSSYPKDTDFKNVRKHFLTREKIDDPKFHSRFCSHSTHHLSQWGFIFDCQDHHHKILKILIAPFNVPTAVMENLSKLLAAVVEKFKHTFR